jgi:hypothetical protein
MNKAQLEEIKKLSKQDSVEDLEKLLEGYLKQSPQATDLWLRLALTELQFPLVDEYKSVKCLEEILKYDPYNANSVLLLAYIHHRFLGGVTDGLLKMLNQLNLEDAECQAMVELAKSWYYSRTDEPPYEKLLVKSVELGPTHVYNHVRLGRYYINKKSKIEKGKALIRTALTNIKGIYFESITVEDFTDINEFFNEHIKGTYLTRSNFKFIEELLKP